MTITVPMYIYQDAETMEIKQAAAISVHWSEYAERKTKWDVVPLNKDDDFLGFRITFDKEKFGIIENTPFKMRLRAGATIFKYIPEKEWESETAPTSVLGKEEIIPGSTGWILYDKKD